MDRATVAVYDRHAADHVRLRLDLGCRRGPVTGAPLDANALGVRAELEALPLRRGVVHGTWASKCLQHVPAERLPLALADLHRAMAVGAPLELVLLEGDGTGRVPWGWSRQCLLDVVVGAGFSDVRLRAAPSGGVSELHLSATRARTLADTVGGGMRMLLCGLNPSLYAADRGVGYARPGNRLWPALRAAGLADVDRDALGLFCSHRIGMTDLVKRATTAASEVSRHEFREGLSRVERLCRWLRPGVVYLVGLHGWRAVVDAKARPGFQAGTLGGVPVYLGPSTSGLNASTQLAGHSAHLDAAAALALRS